MIKKKKVTKKERKGKGNKNGIEGKRVMKKGKY